MFALSTNNNHTQILNAMNKVPLGPMRAEGHLFATFGLIVLAFADRGIRRWLESREVAGSAESIPIGFRGVTPLIDEDPVHVDGQWKPPMRG
ncbi:MAG: hypothetical protein ACPHX2_08535 [Candidatus Poseidoniaceae archaeon]